MKKKNGFISMATIITLIIGICGILIANLAIISSRIYLLSMIKEDVRKDIEDPSYPVCKWSASSTMVMPKNGDKASNTIYITCSDINGLNLANYSYENLTDKQKLKDPTYFKQVIDSLITKDDKIEISYLTVYKDKFSYKFIFGINVSSLESDKDEYYIDFNENVVSNNKAFNKKITSNKIMVVPET